jgi:excisionase family DNA binding protein
MALTRLDTVPAAAEPLKVTEAAIRRWIFERRLTVVKIGSAVRIEEAELARLIVTGRPP